MLTTSPEITTKHMMNTAIGSPPASSLNYLFLRIIIFVKIKNITLHDELNEF